MEPHGGLYALGERIAVYLTKINHKVFENRVCVCVAPLIARAAVFHKAITQLLTMEHWIPQYIYREDIHFCSKR